MLTSNRIYRLWHEITSASKIMVLMLINKNFSYLAILFASIIANIVAFIYQVFFHELPCPLCFFQRFGILVIGYSALKSLSSGRCFKYDILITVSSLFSFSVSVRQLLLHILPGDPGFGSAFLGLHFYTWSAIMSLGLLVFIGFIPLFKFRIDKFSIFASNTVNNILKNVLLILAIANVFSAYLECGFQSCPEDPKEYKLLY